MKKKKIIIGAAAGLVLILLLISVVLNYSVIKDVVVGMGYRPSVEMNEIRSALNLTNAGQIVFNATMPELLEKDEFNQNCREHESEDAILGCYKDGRIYVYNIQSDELSGIREVASAHELLHAVYERMDFGKKQSLEKILNEVYEKNREILGEEIALYSDEEKIEELYVRSGTEIQNLPDELEKHYAEIFKDQDKIVEFYNSYIKVFREIEKNLKELLIKIQDSEVKINEKSTNYKKEAEVLNKDISDFNNCANTPNCFSSNWAFNNRRQTLLARSNALSSMYEEINVMIAKYNDLVKEYNENVLHGQVLNTLINSGPLSEGL